MIYSKSERLWLSVVAIVSIVGINGAFIYGLFMRPGAFQQALANPISLAFILDAVFLLITMTYLLGRWKVMAMSRGLFVVLSLLGGLAFSLPVAALWKSRREEQT